MSQRPRHSTHRSRQHDCRTLHLVDVDNLIGDATSTDSRAFRRVISAYKVVSGYASGDHIVMATGCNGLHVLEAELAWPEALHRRRRGPDGADIELLDSLETAMSAGRYSRIVIGSGDRCFATAARAAVQAGLHVTVVSRRSSTAQDLRSAVGLHVRYMPPIVLN